jgi:hypothetical protein
MAAAISDGFEPAYLITRFRKKARNNMVQINCLTSI